MRVNLESQRAPYLRPLLSLPHFFLIFCLLPCLSFKMQDSVGCQDRRDVDFIDGQPGRDQVKLLDCTGSRNHLESHEGSSRAARGCRGLTGKPFQMWQPRELELGAGPGGRLQSARSGPQCEPHCPAPGGAGLAGARSLSPAPGRPAEPQPAARGGRLAPEEPEPSAMVAAPGQQH